MSNKAYAGIGSRETPQDVLEFMEDFAKRASDAGYVLRSGGAPGADQAFERGARAGATKPEVYLPWPSFEGGRDDAALTEPTPEAMTITANFHPAWPVLRYGARLLHARNVHEVLGPACNDPVAFVVCWTANGRHDGQRRSGGTGQALRIATAYEIPVWNLANPEDVEHVQQCLA